MLRPAHDPAHHDEELVLRSARQAGKRVTPCIDRLSRDRLERLAAECGEEVGVEVGAVVADRRGLAAAVLLAVTDVLDRGIGKRGAAADHPGQRPTSCLVQHLLQRVLCQPLGEVTVRGAAATRPRRPELLLDLAAVGQPVFRIPDRASRPIHPEHVAARRLEDAAHARDSTPGPGHIRDTRRPLAQTRQRKKPRDAGLSQRARRDSNSRPSVP